MRTYLDCIPCFFSQALDAARIAGVSKKKQKEILNELAKILPSISLTSSPPEIGRVVYKMVNRLTGKHDVYLKIKEESTRRALRMYSKLKRKVAHSADRLLTAVELAIAGNVIDYGAKNSLCIDKELEKILKEESRAISTESRVLFNYQEFKRALRNAGTILYLGDNVGETVFDRLLIEEIMKRDKGKKRIIYAVKEKPVINDALIHDALEAGLGNVAEIISSGSDAPGTVLSLCSGEFLKIFKTADLIISKGQGNFEALSDVKRPIFFLFMVKCPVIALDVSSRIGPCNIGDIILLYHQGKKRR